MSSAQTLHALKYRGKPTEQELLEAEVSAAASRLEAVPGKLGEVYDAASHTWILVRESATGQLGEGVTKGSSQALRRLLDQLQDPTNRYIRETAGKSLGSIAVSDNKVCAEIIPILSHEEDCVRETAIASVRIRLHSERVIHALHESQEGRVTAFEAEEKLLEAVHSRVQDSHGRVRYGAVDALSRVIRNFHRDSIAAIIPRLDDNEEWVRRYATEILCESLASGEEMLANKSYVAATYMAEGYNELLYAALQCYDKGDGHDDVFMRKSAILGLTAAASVKEAPKEISQDLGQDYADGDEHTDWLPDSRTSRRYTAEDAIGTLQSAMKDKDLEIREMASSALLQLAAEGVQAAINAVMGDIDTLLADAVHRPGLGMNGTPEIVASLGHERTDEEARQANEDRQRSAAEAHQAWLQEQERLEQLDIVEEEVYALYDLVETGMVEELHYKAFPPPAQREEVLALEEAVPERRSIRSAAAEHLQRMAAQGSEEVAAIISDNLEEFCGLLGQADLLAKASGRISAQRDRERVVPRAPPETALCEQLRDRLLDSQEAHERQQAAVRLSQLAEQGDDAAAAVVMEHAAEFLRELKEAGVMRGRLLTAGQVLLDQFEWK